MAFTARASLRGRLGVLIAGSLVVTGAHGGHDAPDPRPTGTQPPMGQTPDRWWPTARL